jgi:putative SOS response-associated peptidase YedK
MALPGPRPRIFTWLRRGRLEALLKSCPDEALKIWPVDKMVGNVKNNGPQLILPVVSNEVPA